MPFLVAGLLSAQSPAPSPADSAADTNAESGGRLHILQLETIARFNYMDREGGPVTDRGLQYRIRNKTRLDLLGDGSTYLTMRAETGRGFDNSWNNSGVGLNSRQWVFNVKTFALHQLLGSHYEVQAGGIEFDPGSGTASTYASGDGAMTGYRVIMRKTAGWQPDSLSLTAGYVGDFNRPNVFSRFYMDRVNYMQLLAQHRLTDHLEISGEVDSIRGVPFNREALHFQKLSFFDNAVLEQVVRLNSGVAVGWSALAEHNWSTRWSTSLLYSQMPDQLYVINGQRVFFNRGEIATGKRLSSGATFHVKRDVEIGTFAGRLLDSTPSKRWVAQASVGVQYADLANRLVRRLSSR